MSAERWLNPISKEVLENMKKILGGLRPLTLTKVKHLSPVNSMDAGAYARLVTSRYPVQAASDQYLHVGSASKYGCGLQGRVN